MRTTSAGSDLGRWTCGRWTWSRIFLIDGTQLHAVTGVDDHSRFCVCARLVARATAKPVCDALAFAMRAHGVPEQILTDNGKVFTARFGPGPGPVLFDRICIDNGIRHLLTAPYSPTTTGKVERFHRTLRQEWVRLNDWRLETIVEAQASLDAWVEHYNTERPHQSLGMASPVERFRLVAGRRDVVEAAEAPPTVIASRMRPAGVTRWVDQRGSISLAGLGYRVGVVFAGECVEVVCHNGLVEIFHAGVLVATHTPHRRVGEGPASSHPRSLVSATPPWVSASSAWPTAPATSASRGPRIGPSGA